MLSKVFPRTLAGVKIAALEHKVVVRLWTKWVHLYYRAAGTDGRVIEKRIEASVREERMEVVPFIRRILGPVRRLVLGLNKAFHDTERLLQTAREGGELSRFAEDGMAWDRADRMGNTPLHWACRRGDVEQVEFLSSDLESFGRACRANHKGETPISLATKDCGLVVAFKLGFRYGLSHR